MANETYYFGFLSNPIIILVSIKAISTSKTHPHPTSRIRNIIITFSRIFNNI